MGDITKPVRSGFDADEPEVEGHAGPYAGQPTRPGFDADEPEA